MDDGKEVTGMAVGGIDAMMQYYSTSARSVSGLSPQMFDYKAAQKQTQSLIDSYKQNNNQIKTLKKESADFLKEYTGSMNALNGAAAKLTNGAATKTLFDKEGNSSEQSVKDTVNLAKDMVTAYNDSLKVLNDNADRGSGVLNQMGRMADDVGTKESMEMLGFSANKDGTLVLDEEKLTAALSDENPLQQRLAADLLGGPNGIAAGVQKDARAGLNTSAGSLINNDIAKMQSVRDNDPIRTFAQSLRGGGAYALNNSAAMGILMNMVV